MAAAPARLVAGETAADLVEHARLRLVSLGQEGGFEVGKEYAAEFGVGFRSGHELVEPAPGFRELLCCPSPALGGRWEHPDQPC